MKSIVLLFITLFLSSPVMAQDQVSSRILEGGTINCGYAPWNPILFRDLESNELKGAAKEIVEKIGSKLDLSINWAEEAQWGNIVEGLKTNRYDMICVVLGAVGNRAKVANFTEEIFYLPIYAITRADDNRFENDISVLNSEEYKIGVLEGEFSAILANERFQKAQVVSIPQMSDYSLLMEDIKAGKTDVSFISGETFAEYDKKFPGVLKISSKGKPMATVPGAFALPHGNPIFAELLDVTIHEMHNDGSIEAILDKYDPEGKFFLRVAKPYKE